MVHRVVYIRTAMLFGCSRPFSKQISLPAPQQPLCLFVTVSLLRFLKLKISNHNETISRNISVEFTDVCCKFFINCKNDKEWLEQPTELNMD